MNVYASPTVSGGNENTYMNRVYSESERQFGVPATSAVHLPNLVKSSSLEAYNKPFGCMSNTERLYYISANSLDNLGIA